MQFLHVFPLNLLPHPFSTLLRGRPFPILELSFDHRRYLAAFNEKGYGDMRLMRHLTTEDLDAIGVLVPGHRKLLLLAAEDLKNAGTSSMY